MTTTYQPSLSAEKKQEALRVATQLYSQSPDWLTFFREVLGIGGVVRRLFTTQAEFLAFEQTTEFGEIQQLVSNLRSLNNNPPANQEPTRVITVRLPKSLHEALRAEAHDHKTSMNKLCISKLLQALYEESLENQEALPATNRETTTTPQIPSFTRPENRPALNSQPTQTTSPRTVYGGSTSTPTNPTPPIRTYPPESPNGF